MFDSVDNNNKNIKFEEFRKYFFFLKIIPENNLLSLYKILNKKEKVVIKFGVDPTSNFLHLGHFFIFYYLRKILNLFDNIYLKIIIGGFTSFIGDPTNRNDQRTLIYKKEIEDNYKIFYSKIKFFFKEYSDKVEILNNKDWLEKISFGYLFFLLKKISLYKLISRKDIKKRIFNKKSISSDEILYPILQGLDSVYLANDIEIGGVDQLFNIFFSRYLQQICKVNKIQIGVLFPLLPSLKSKVKISKNQILSDISSLDSINDVFSKVVFIDDEKIKIYMKNFNFNYDENISIENFIKKKINFAIFISKLFVMSDNKYNELYFKNVFSLMKKHKVKFVTFYSKDKILTLNNFFFNILKLSKNKFRDICENNACKINDKCITSNSMKDFEVDKVFNIKVEKRIFIIK